MPTLLMPSMCRSKSDSDEGDFCTQVTYLKIRELTIDLKKCKSKEQEWRQQTHFDILKANSIACETNSTEVL